MSSKAVYIHHDTELWHDLDLCASVIWLHKMKVYNLSETPQIAKSLFQSFVSS